MNRKARSQGRKAAVGVRSGERIQRFLRPGALACLRDSKIISRSPGSALKTAQIAAIRFSPPASPSASAAPPPTGEREGELIRFFSSRSRGPRQMNRKKLFAAKYVYFSPPSPDLSDAVLDSFNVDLVTAH